MSSITLQQKGITNIPADAIVNAANSGLWAGESAQDALAREIRALANDSMKNN